MTPPLTTTLDPATILERIYIERDFFLGNEKRARDAAIEDAKDFAQPAPPTEALRLLTAMVEHHDMMGMTPIMGHSCEAAREARRYLAATEEGT